MKTILILTWFYLPFIGGAELFVRAVTERLRRRYRFLIVTARAERRLPPREEISGVRLVRVGMGNRADKLLYPLPALWSALRAEPVDLVHAIMVNASALTAYAYLKLRKRPSLLTLQEGDSEAYVRGYLGPLFPIYPRLHRPFDRIHAISSFLRDQAVQYGADPSTIDVVPNGVDTEHFHPAARSPEEVSALKGRLGLEGKRVLVSVSRLVAKNGLSDLLRALPILRRAYPETVLLLVGEGGERRSLETLAKDLHIEDSVRFVGAVPPDETNLYLLISDAFVRPSLSEGLGSAFLEAMACGLPVIGTPVGGIVDFLRDGQTGLFCAPEQPESLARAVLRLFDEPELAQRLASEARRLVLEHYDWDLVSQRIAAIYEELLAT